MRKIYDLTLFSLLLTILIICSKLTVPYYIPFTLQTLAVAIISMILKGKKAFLLILIYILIGLIGLPVFASGGGFHYLQLPSFGFILGFLFYAIFVGFLTDKNDSFYYLVIINVIGEIIVYIFGAGYMFLLYNILNNPKSLIYIINIAIIPFFAFDFLKIIIGVFIYKRIKNFI